MNLPPLPRLETTVETTVVLTVTHEPGVMGESESAHTWTDVPPKSEASSLETGAAPRPEIPPTTTPSPTIKAPPPIEAASSTATPPNMDFERDTGTGFNKRPSSAFSTSAFSSREPKKKPIHLIPLRFLKGIPIPPIPIPNLKHGNNGSAKTNDRISKLIYEH